MGRKPHTEIPDGIFHVWARGNSRQILFADDDDRERYLSILADTIGECHWRCLAYVLMGNHLHLIIQTPRANLSRGMGAAHNAYARYFNARHERINHLFGDRFGRAALHDPQHVRRIAVYVARNPVEAGLCRRPQDWRWNSYAAVAGDLAPGWLDVDTLAGHFGGKQYYLDSAVEVRESDADAA